MPLDLEDSRKNKLVDILVEELVVLRATFEGA